MTSLPDSFTIIPTPNYQEIRSNLLPHLNPFSHRICSNFVKEFGPFYQEFRTHIVTNLPLMLEPFCNLFRSHLYYNFLAILSKIRSHLYTYLNHDELEIVAVLPCQISQQFFQECRSHFVTNLIAFYRKIWAILRNLVSHSAKKFGVTTYKLISWTNDKFCQIKRIFRRQTNRVFYKYLHVLPRNLELFYLMYHQIKRAYFKKIKYFISKIWYFNKVIVSCISSNWTLSVRRFYEWSQSFNAVFEGISSRSPWHHFCSDFI